MNLFQIIVVPCALIAFLWCSWKSIRGPGRYARIVNSLLAFVWLLASIFIINPGLTAKAAQMLGVGRGTDLIIYVFIIIAILYAMFIYYRLCDIRKDITLIIRHIAIAERQIPTKGQPGKSEKDNDIKENKIQKN